MQSREDVPALIGLPIELRRSIYAYLLPHTVHSLDPASKPAYSLTYVRPRIGSDKWMMRKSNMSDREGADGIVWFRGCTALLAVNRQIHEETADMLYGENVFVLDVKFDTINFRHRWRSANGLCPNRNYAFLENFSQRNLLRIKKYVISVESVDDYTGMIKYNCQGRGLSAGMRTKVKELVEQLAAVECLHQVQVHLIDGAISRVKFPSGRVHPVLDEANYAQTQTVLEPFRALRGVRRVAVSGVSEEYAEDLTRSMTAQRGACQT